MRFVLASVLCLLLCISVLPFSGSGVPAENFTAVSLDGKTVNLEDLRGKIVVLTFWSTRCPICESEIPKFNQIANKYNGKDVVFLGLTMENEIKVTEHLKKKPFNFTILPNSLGVIMKYADRDAAGNFNISYPSTFVIDQSGNIALKTNGWDKAKSIDSQISRLLANK